MRRLGRMILAMAGTLLAQDQNSAPKAVTNASISGIVRAKDTGAPLAGYNVSVQVNAQWVGNTILMNSATKEVNSISDESGRYRLAGLPAGGYRVSVRNAVDFGSSVSRSVTVNGEDLDDINFDVVVSGSIKGKVVDENKDPIPGITVFLVSREYMHGTLGYFLKEASRPTNDRGEYILPHVPAGRGSFLLAEKRASKIPAHSETPLDPKLRRRVPIRTWYPNSPSKEAAEVLTLRAGESRDGVDIQMKKAPAFCAEGTLMTPGGTGAIDFSIEAQQPSSGITENGGFYVGSAHGVTGKDGAFRICDLYPGSYRLQAQSLNDKLSFGEMNMTISDEDIKRLKLTAQTGVAIAGEVVLDGPAPDPPLDTKVRISLDPLLRSHLSGERLDGVKADIPGSFSFAEVIVDDYSVRTLVNGPGLYIKDVTYAGRSVRYEALRMGSTVAGSGLRVTVGKDGATVSSLVSNKDGLPIGDATVVIMPRAVSSESALESELIIGKTDQNGTYQSQSLAPGSYYVGAVDQPIDNTPEGMGRLWRSLSRLTEVDLPPNGKSQIALQPVQLIQ